MSEPSAGDRMATPERAEKRIDAFETIYHVARTTFVRSFRGKRILWVALIIALPALLSLAVGTRGDPEDQEAFFYGILLLYHFGVTVPTVALVLASGFPWPASDDGTLTYWFTAPVWRWAVHIGRTIGCLLVGILILPISVLALGLPLTGVEEPGLTRAMITAITATVLAYPAYYALMSLASTLTRWALVIGIVYVLIENFLSFLSGGIGRITMVYYVRSMMWPDASELGREVIQEAAQIDDPAGNTASIIVFVGVAVLFTAVSAVLMQVIEYRGKHRQAN